MALDLSRTGKKLIEKLAASKEDGVFYLCYETGSTEDPDTGQVTPGVKERIPTGGARIEYSQSLIDGVNIQTGDFQLLLPYDLPIPDSNYWFEADSGSYAVISPDEINPSGFVQVYKMQLRRQ